VSRASSAAPSTRRPSPRRAASTAFISTLTSTPSWARARRRRAPPRAGYGSDLTAELAGVHAAMAARRIARRCQYIVAWYRVCSSA
jgi:hypothetical protein